MLNTKKWQNMLLENMPLWHKDNFKLKAIEKKQIQELSALPHLPKSRTYICNGVSPPLSTKDKS